MPATTTMTHDAIREFQEVVAIAVCEYGGHLAAVLLPERDFTWIAEEDPFTQLGVLLRAHRSVDTVGSPGQVLSTTDDEYLERFSRFAMGRELSSRSGRSGARTTMRECRGPAQRALAMLDKIDSTTGTEQR